MNQILPFDHDRYAKCIEVSKRIRWDIDKDVIRGRTFDIRHKFLPDSLTRLDRIEFLTADEKRLMSQIQGRTYANIFGLVERYIGAKMLQISQGHWLGDQVALEALVRFTDEELKHQELFRRIEGMMAEAMPPGYRMTADANGVAKAVLAKSTWAVLALTCHIELFTLVHYRHSIEPEDNVSPLFKDVFLYHWREESQHAILDELEWQRCHEGCTREEIDRGVDDLIALVDAVDGILKAQAAADVAYFKEVSGAGLFEANLQRLEAAVVGAYRWQYIISGVQVPKFQELLAAKITPEQSERITNALAPIMADA